MNDAIIINGLEVFARHGVLAEEKRDGQLFYLDLELETDLSAASESDNLADTIDYDAVCRAAGDAMTRDCYDLIERAAGEVCRVLLDTFFALERVTVTLRKPDAPLCIPAGYAAVRLTRSRR